MFERKQRWGMAVNTPLIGRLGKPVAWSSVLLLCCFHSLARGEVRYALEVGGGRSDNITRVEQNEVAETIATAGIELAWSEQTQRIDGLAAVDLTYMHYVDDTYDAELLGTADGVVVFGIVPERFTWTLQDSFGQAQSDPFAPSTPETRENVNYLTTGPDLIVRFGRTSFARLFGRYSLTSYEESPLDADRLAGGVSFGWRPSARSEFALNAITERNEFQDLVGLNDYDRQYAFFSYGLEGARTEIVSEIGYTWIDHEDGRSNGGPLARIFVDRRLSPSTTLELTVGTQITDAGEVLQSTLEQGPVGGVTGITATEDPFENRYGTIEWNFSRNRTGLSIGFGWSEDRYERQTTFDRTRYVYDASMSRHLTPFLSAALFGTLTDEQFDTTGLEAEELRAGFSVLWAAGRRFGLNLIVERYDRETSNGVGQFVETRGFLTITYSPRGRVGEVRTRPLRNTI